MKIPPNATLLRLSDTSLTLADDKLDIRGRKVHDANQQELGKIDDLIIDSKEKKVRFLEVSSGGFLGLGAQKFLIPIDTITRITKDMVYINRTREHVAGAPKYNPKLILEDVHLDRLYGYYGFSPYWVPGYTYPTFPYYL
jgi:sporulation protein YlmC with PRC-barrel domain